MSHFLVNELVCQFFHFIADLVCTNSDFSCYKFDSMSQFRIFIINMT